MSLRLNVTIITNTASGGACFISEVSNEATADPDREGDCPRCRPSAVKLDWKQTQHILEHMGAHILFDATLNASEEYCGLCLHPSPMCQIYINKGCGADGRVSVDLSRSTCPNLICFNYKSAAQSSQQSPCSNVPVVCPHCPPSSPAVWRYSLHSHFCGHH